jgi:hypothetical protein
MTIALARSIRKSIDTTTKGSTEMEDLEVKVIVRYSLTGADESKPCRAHLSAQLPEQNGKLHIALRGSGCWGYGIFYDNNVVVEDTVRAATWEEIDKVVEELIDDLKRTLRSNVVRNRSLEDSMPGELTVYFTV